MNLAETYRAHGLVLPAAAAPLAYVPVRWAVSRRSLGRCFARFARCDGAVTAGSVRIMMNRALLTLPAKLLRDTLNHETAHALAFTRHGLRGSYDGHGPLWRQACEDIGAPGLSAVCDTRVETGVAAAVQNAMPWAWVCEACALVGKLPRRPHWYSRGACCPKCHEPRVRAYRKID
jgi:predicted SprT family Zn-dependent metalloprotease